MPHDVPLSGISDDVHPHNSGPPLESKTHGAHADPKNSSNQRQDKTPTEKRRQGSTGLAAQLEEPPTLGNPHITFVGSTNHCMTDTINISSNAILGNIVRVYLGRLMGADCEDADSSPNDFATPFFQNICITSGGRTVQTGGALFRDLPANMLGCFILGILAASTTISNIGTVAPVSSPLPWLHKDHPLQHHTALHTGLGVGFCGCLTTFSSWNTQMVIMLVRTDRPGGVLALVYIIRLLQLWKSHCCRIIHLVSLLSGRTGLIQHWGIKSHRLCLGI
jgi:fluoride ion exporter CrcB/FEX